MILCLKYPQNAWKAPGTQFLGPILWTMLSFLYLGSSHSAWEQRLNRWPEAQSSHLGFATHSAMIWGKTWLPQSLYSSCELLVGDKRKDVFESMA